MLQQVDSAADAGGASHLAEAGDGVRDGAEHEGSGGGIEGAAAEGEALRVREHEVGFAAKAAGAGSVRVDGSSVPGTSSAASTASAQT